MNPEPLATWVRILLSPPQDRRDAVVKIVFGVLLIGGIAIVSLTHRSDERDFNTLFKEAWSTSLAEHPLLQYIRPR